MSAPDGQATRLALIAHEWHRDGEVETHEFGLRVPRDLRWLRGHFDGNPVLPAVVQLREAYARTREVWPDLSTACGVPRASFRRPVRPSDSLLLRLGRREGRSKISFEYLRGGETCSAGEIEFQPVNSGGCGR